MTLKLFILPWLLASPLVMSAAAERSELTSHELHQLQRQAMHAAIQNASASSPTAPDTNANGDKDASDFASAVFSSVKEQRAYYYFHAGMEMAAMNTMILSGEKEEVASDDGLRLDWLEEKLEYELERVRKELGEIDIDDDDDDDDDDDSSDDDDGSADDGNEASSEDQLEDNSDDDDDDDDDDDGKGSSSQEQEDSSDDDDQSDHMTGEEDNEEAAEESTLDDSSDGDDENDSSSEVKQESEHQKMDEEDDEAAEESTPYDSSDDDDEKDTSEEEQQASEHQKMGEVEEEAAEESTPEDSSDDDEEAAAEITPVERLQEKFSEQYTIFQCYRHKRVLSLDDFESKWNEMRYHFWKFAKVANDDDDDITRSSSTQPSEGKEDEYEFFVPNPGLYVDFIPTKSSVDKEEDEIISDGDTKPKRRGLFAARDFEEGDVVYRPDAFNRIWFQDSSEWISFLNHLPDHHTSCLALDWSYTKQISRPGRWMLGLVLDESIFMRRLSGDDEGSLEVEGNIEQENDRTFDYVATRDIAEGEEVAEPAASE